MSDRTINFGESETEATYQIQDTDSTGGGNFVVAKDTNANTVLLQYDPATDTWEYAGDVDMNGGNVSAVGSLTADSVNTEDVESEDADITSASMMNANIGGSETRIDEVYGAGLNWSWEFDDTEEWVQIDLSDVDIEEGEIYRLTVRNIRMGSDELRLTVDEFDEGVVEGYETIRLLETDPESSQDHILIGASDSNNTRLSMTIEFGFTGATDFTFWIETHSTRIHRWTTAPAIMGGGAESDLEFNSIEIFRGGGTDPTQDDEFDMNLTKLVDVSQGN